MFWVLPSGSSRYRKLLNRFWNVCNLVNRCITYLFVWFVTPVAKVEDYVVLYLIGWCSSLSLYLDMYGILSPVLSPPLNLGLDSGLDIYMAELHVSRN